MDNFDATRKALDQALAVLTYEKGSPHPHERMGRVQSALQRTSREAWRAFTRAWHLLLLRQLDMADPLFTETFSQLARACLNHAAACDAVTSLVDQAGPLPPLFPQEVSRDHLVHSALNVMDALLTHKATRTHPSIGNIWEVQPTNGSSES